MCGEYRRAENEMETKPTGAKSESPAEAAWDKLEKFAHDHPETRLAINPEALERVSESPSPTPAEPQWSHDDYQKIISNQAAELSRLSAEKDAVEKELAGCLEELERCGNERNEYMEQVDALRAALRSEWWSNHGCPDRRYGDDGEMQCHGCGVDFKRTDFEQLRQRVSELRLIAACKSVSGEKA